MRFEIKKMATFTFVNLSLDISRASWRMKVSDARSFGYFMLSHLSPTCMYLTWNSLLRSLNTILEKSSKILPIDKMFCLLLPNLMVHRAITFKIYKIPQFFFFWGGGAKIAQEAFYSVCMIVFMSASRTH